MDYEIKAVYAGQSTPLVVEVSFLLDYHEWLKLKDSDAWHHLEEAVSSIQKETGRKESSDLCNIPNSHCKNCGKS